MDQNREAPKQTLINRDNWSSMKAQRQYKGEKTAFSTNFFFFRKKKKI